MSRYYSIMLFMILVITVSCSNGQKASESEVEFKKITGEITGEIPSPTAENPDITAKVTYDVDWPVKGDEELVSSLRSWIVNQMSGGEIEYGDGVSVEGIAKEMAEKIFGNLSSETDDIVELAIDISAESNIPSDGYLSLHYIAETTQDWGVMNNYSQTENNLTIRISDKKQFNAETSIGDKEKFRKIIIKNWKDWQGDLDNSSSDIIPYPDDRGIVLTKDGIIVRYPVRVFYGARAPAGNFEITIPYNEAIPALSQEGLSFLGLLDNEQSNAKKSGGTEIPAMTEEYAIDVIKKANAHNSNVLTSDFKEVWDKVDPDKEWVLLNYGYGIDVVDVTNPEIKILKVISNSEDRETLVIFDFRDKDASQMGWCGEDEYSQKICAMSFKYENGQWVVDDFYQAIGAGRDNADDFNKNSAESTKSNLKNL